MRPPAFTSTLRSERLTARVGIWLGVAFGICFLTGLVSHWHYLDESGDAWIPAPTSPVWLYQLTQGLHVASGTAAIPLLLVKLWGVFPKLFAAIPRPPRELVLHLAERASIAVLVAGAVTELVIGLANAAQWYPWSGDFSFRAVHYAIAWLVTGALVLHIAIKLPVIRRGLTQPLEEATGPGPSRRTVLHAGLLSAGVAVLASAGSTVPWLRQVSVFGVRSGEGPQGIPVNKSARAAGVVATALDPAFRITVSGAREVTLSRADLAALPQHSYDLPIACVEGWSASGRWTGVRLRDLMSLVDAPAQSRVRVHSAQESGPFRITDAPPDVTADDRTLLALSLDGEALSIDHGYPCRLIAPGRPGVFQTKWVRRIEVRT